jgi:hypothetical protein
MKKLWKPVFKKVINKTILSNDTFTLLNEKWWTSHDKWRCLFIQLFVTSNS